MDDPHSSVESNPSKANFTVDSLANEFEDEVNLEEEEPSSSASEGNSVDEMSGQKFPKLFYESENQENEHPKGRFEQDKYPDASRLLRSKVIEEDEDRFHLRHSDDENRMIIKTIMVGSDYQAIIPDGLCHYGDALPYENEDKLLWDPSISTPEAVESYLREAASICKPSIPRGKHLRDNEPALHLLQQCGHNVEEALRRLQINKHLYEDTMQIWSEEECRNFEAGIRLFGKNFYMTQQNKVRTRSVGELVQFYYLWKKTERHDMFANKVRLEKKKYILHPGVTDFMDRFLEEHDSRDRSSSPNVNPN